MQDPIYILADNIISPLGNTTQENFFQIGEGKSSIQEYKHPQIGKYVASCFHAERYHFSDCSAKGFTPIETLIIDSIKQLIAQVSIQVDSGEVLFVFSTTKGNISLLGHNTFDKGRMRLGAMAKTITDYFNNPNEPVVISNACISGLQAIQYACFSLSQKKYKYVVVSGADMVSDFVLAGFSSFQALSPFPCTPFDKNRAGLSLGEGAGSLLLSNEALSRESIEIASIASSNDANHLSGPSRTGEGLSNAIHNALHLSRSTGEDIDLISSHGTATMYNDEMESLAFQTSGLLASPVYSTKGNLGHTLGAAGIIETIILGACMKNSQLLPSWGYKEQGTSVNLNIIKESKKATIRKALKTASGFGGGNTALVLKKAI